MSHLFFCINQSEHISNVANNWPVYKFVKVFVYLLIFKLRNNNNQTVLNSLHFTSRSKTDLYRPTVCNHFSCTGVTKTALGPGRGNIPQRMQTYAKFLIFRYEPRCIRELTVALGTSGVPHDEFMDTPMPSCNLYTVSKKTGHATLYIIMPLNSHKTQMWTNFNNYLTVAFFMITTSPQNLAALPCEIWIFNFAHSQHVLTFFNAHVKQNCLFISQSINSIYSIYLSDMLNSVSYVHAD